MATTTNTQANTATQMIGATSAGGVVKPEMGKVFGAYDPTAPELADRYHRHAIATASQTDLGEADHNEHRGHYLL